MFVLNRRLAVVVHLRPVEDVMASMRSRSRVFGTQGSGCAASRGFTLIELLVVIAIIALLISILLPSLGTARSSSRRAVCISNMKQFGVGVQGYATDFYDKLVAFTWRKGVDYGFGGVANNANLAAANQAVDIMRRRAERTDMTQIDGWIPFPLYIHLVLNDYLGQRLPEPMVACPEDRLRQLWQRAVVPDPLNFHRLAPNNERPGTRGERAGEELVEPCVASNVRRGRRRHIDPVARDETAYRPTCQTAQARRSEAANERGQCLFGQQILG